MSAAQSGALLKTDEGIQIRVVFNYTDIYNGTYETSFCLVHQANGSVGPCEHDNYIK